MIKRSSKHGQRKSISQELHLLDQSISRFSSPTNTNQKFFEQIKKTSALDKALKISNMRNKIEVVKRCVRNWKESAYHKDVSLLTTHQRSLIDERLVSNQPVKISMISQDKHFPFPGPDEEDRFKKLVVYLLETRIKRGVHFKTLSQRAQILLNYTFEPSSWIIIMWNLVIIMVIFHNLLMMPLADSFPVDYMTWECSNTRKLIQFEFGLLILDIILQLRVGLIQQGNVILDQRAIMKEYFKQGLFLDLIALFGFAVFRFNILFMTDCEFSYSLTISVLKYSFFAKRHRFKGLKIVNQGLSSSAKNYIRLFELLMLVVLAAHYIACIWIAVGKYALSIYTDRGWLILKLDLMDFEIYLQAMYFACMTMTTVGYGDIHPKNPIEYIACIMIMLVSCGFFAYILNTITHILSAIRNRKQQYIQELEIIQNYMRKRKIEGNLQNRVQNYLKCIQEAGLNDNHLEEKAVFSKLNVTLQTQLLLADKGKIFQNIPAIKEHFSKDFQLQIIDKMKEVRMSPGETIHMGELNEKEVQSQGIFLYVRRGSLDFSFKNKMGLVKVFSLQEGDHYGLPHLFRQTQDQANKLTMKSNDFSIIYTLNYEDIRRSLDPKPENQDKQKFYMMCEKLQVERLNLKCQLCGLHNHEIGNCNMFFMKPNRKIVIARSEYSTSQLRMNFSRNPRKTTSLIGLRLNQEAAYPFSEELLEEEEEFNTESQKQIVQGKFSKYYSEVGDQLIREKTELEDQSSCSIIFADGEGDGKTNSVNTSIEKKTVVKPTYLPKDVQLSPKSRTERQHSTLGAVVKSILKKDIMFTSQLWNRRSSSQIRISRSESNQLDDFERMYEYDLFNAHNNISKVLKRVNRSFRKRLKGRLKSDKSSPDPKYFERN